MPPLTCRNDSYVERTWHQVSIRLVLVHAVVCLGPGHQRVQDLTEHPISTHAHHPGPTNDSNSHVWQEICDAFDGWWGFRS